MLQQRKNGKTWNKLRAAQARASGPSALRRATPAAAEAPTQRVMTRSARPAHRLLGRTRRWEAVAARFDASTKIRGVELGAWKGTGTSGLLKCLPNLQLTSIDAWSSGIVQDGSKYCGFDAEEWSAIEEEYYRAVQPYCTRIKTVKSGTDNTSCVEPGLDFVFIDADHSYEGCRDDIARWWPMVKPGGYLCGHDYGAKRNSAHDKPGVTQAVNEFLTKTGLRVITDVDATWFVKKPEVALEDAAILTVMFGKEQRPLFDAHIASVEANVPGAEFLCVDPGPAPSLGAGLPKFSSVNVHKLKVWAREVERHKGKNLILLDGDTLVLKDPRVVFNKPFDICFTDRDDANQRINAGVVFVRCNEKTVKFFRKWCEYDQRITEDRQLFKTAQKLIKGQNQASLGLMLDRKDIANCDIQYTPCELWNCTNQLWRTFDPAVCGILHVKNFSGVNNFREYVLGTPKGRDFNVSAHRKVVETWNRWSPAEYVRKI